MAALTQAFETFERPGIVMSYKQAAVKIYKGAIVALNAAGYVQPMAHGTANLKFVGVANETVDNTAGAAGDKSVTITKTGSFVFKAVAGFNPAITDLGKEVYANTDWEVQAATAGLTNQYKIGTIVTTETTSGGLSGVRVRVDNYSV